MGRIGYALAKRCRGGWDMKVLYHDVYREREGRDRSSAPARSISTRCLRESDFVSVHTDLNDDDARPVRRRRSSRKMKRTAVFVNTARGPLVDQKALAEALKTGDDLRGRPGRDRPGAARRRTTRC